MDGFLVLSIAVIKDPFQLVYSLRLIV